MRLIAISQRVAVAPPSGERRDCLDQAWIKFMATCGLTPLPVPNDEQAAQSLCNAMPVNGILLTGGNDLSAYGGDAPERDATESVLIDIRTKSLYPFWAYVAGCR